jgi:tetratricopeptide (TPR) repeat protein
LTREFLLLCNASHASDDSASGCCIELFSLSEWAVVSIFRHSDAAQLIACDQTGIRLLLLDASQTPYVYSAVDEHLLPFDCGQTEAESVGETTADFTFDANSASVDACLLLRPDFPGADACRHLPVAQANAAGEFPLQATHILWDQSHSARHVFVAIDAKHVHVFALVERSIQGRFVQFVGRCNSIADEQPLLLYDGTLYSHNSQGRFVQRPLSTHYVDRTLSNRIQGKAEIAALSTLQSSNGVTQASVGVATNVDPVHQPFALRTTTATDAHFVNALRLRRYNACLHLCERVAPESRHISAQGHPDVMGGWVSVVQCALHDLNVSLALKVCRRLGWAGAVAGLKRIQNTEEAVLLAGQIAELLQLFELAEWMYLRSTRPRLALDMRQRLMQWNASITLARRLRPSRLKWLHRQQAEQSEFDGQHSTAYDHFSLALQMSLSQPTNVAAMDSQAGQLAQRQLIAGDVHTLHCVAGMARASAKLGNARKAIELATRLLCISKSSDLASVPQGFSITANRPKLRRRLVIDIAQLLAEAKCLLEAGTLFEQVGDLESACLWQLKARNVTKVRELIARAESSGAMSDKVLRNYAQLQEAEGRPKEALKAYGKAQQYSDCVRLLLDKLNSPDEAVALARNKRVHESYSAIAQYFKKRHDYASAIEFLVRSGKYEEAFSTASNSSLVDHYAAMLLEAYRAEMGAQNDSIRVAPTKRIPKDEQSKARQSSASSDPDTKIDLDQLIAIDRLDPIDLLQSEPTLPVARDPEWTARFQSIAVFYEQERQYLSAGQFYCLSAHLKKGVRLLLQVCSGSPDLLDHRLSVGGGPSITSTTSISASNGESIDSLDSERVALRLAVQFAPDTNDERCLRSLTDVLLGEQDGRPKDFRLLLQLHLRCGQTREAVRVALLLARELQNAGSYREAHALLRSVCVQLRSIENQSIPSALMDALHSLHCYQLLRLATGSNRLRLAAALLTRLCIQLGRFHSQAGSLLASAVVIHVKLNRRSAAKQFAGQLLRRSEWAKQVQPSVRRKIEALVRRSALNRSDSANERVSSGSSVVDTINSIGNLSTAHQKDIDKRDADAAADDDDEAERQVEQSSGCSHCDQSMGPLQLNCDSCRGSMSFCVLSGCAVRPDQFVVCEGCRLPMLTVQLKLWTRLGLTICAMCGHSLPVEGDSVSETELPIIS